MDVENNSLINPVKSKIFIFHIKNSALYLNIIIKNTNHNEKT